MDDLTVKLAGLAAVLCGIMFLQGIFLCFMDRREKKRKDKNYTQSEENL